MYKNNRNNANVYNRTGKTVSIQEGLLKCPGGQLSSQTSINLDDIVGYSYTIYVKILFQSTTSQSYNFTISLNNIQIYQQPVTKFQQCNDIKIANLSFSF